jgi:methylthioribose-1-phosphate isomerase
VFILIILILLAKGFVSAYHPKKRVYGRVATGDHIVKEFSSLGLRYIEGRIEVLDQRLLPDQEIWRHVTHPREMERMIKQLSLRGAPLISIGAAVSLARYAEQGASIHELREAGEFLRHSCSTAVNLAAAVDSMLGKVENSEEFIAAADALVEEEMR